MEGLGKPYGVAVRGSKVYLCDIEKGDVLVADLATRKHHWLGSSRRINLKKPINATVDEKGNIFIADAGLAKIVMFDERDQFVKSYDGPAGWRPTDVAVKDQNIFVVDAENNQIKVFDRGQEKITRAFGKSGSGQGEMFKPTNIAMDKNNFLYVSDTINFRIQKFSLDGVFKASFGQAGRTPGSFSRPKGISLDRKGRIYAVDAAFDNVQIFDPKGRALLFFGGTGNEEGQMYLPADVFIDYGTDNIRRFQEFADPRLKLEYLVWVTNQYGPRPLSVYGFGLWKNKK